MARLVATEGVAKAKGELLREASVGTGPDSQRVRHDLNDSLGHFVQPMSRKWADPITRFVTLKSEWMEATRFSSSVHEIAMHPSYQSIIGMGEVALPFIFAELKREPLYWFWALRAITGVDPVRPANRGDIEAMAAAWLRWARKEGYVDE